MVADRRDAAAGEDVWLPLYEAKLIHQYDHRFATYEADGTTRDVTEAEHRDPEYVPLPRYWVQAGDVAERTPEQLNSDWFLSYRDIVRATDVRTLIASAFPRVGAGNHLIGPSESDGRKIASLIGSLNSLILDFATRQKAGGTHLNFFITKQLPVLPPEAYSAQALEYIVPRVLELTYTAWDLQPFARDCGYDGPPFAWDEERRAQLRAELDGIYAHLYGLNRDDFAYILDTFPIVQRNDERRFGEYRTKRLCLEAYDLFAGLSTERT